MIVEFIDEARGEFGVAPICDALQVAPSTYYSAKTRPPLDRAIRDAVMMPVLWALWKANYSVYGARKLWIAARNAGHQDRPGSGGPLDARTGDLGRET